VVDEEECSDFVFVGFPSDLHTVVIYQVTDGLMVRSQAFMQREGRAARLVHAAGPLTPHDLTDEAAAALLVWTRTLIGMSEP
jgi:hypothetical protein